MAVGDIDTSLRILDGDDERDSAVTIAHVPGCGCCADCFAVRLGLSHVPTDDLALIAGHKLCLTADHKAGVQRRGFKMPRDTKFSN
jgi:hypothetical protein